MTPEHRDAIRAANQRRAISCPGCNQTGTRHERDGSEIGGLPGIKYKVCSSCGHTAAITKRPRRFKLD